MRFPEIERIVLDAVDQLVAAGVSREAAERAMQEAEVLAVLDLIETDRDKRLIDLFQEYGSAALAERKKTTQRTVTRHRNEAIERMTRKKIGHAVSAPEAA